MMPRMHKAIAMGPMGNLQGTGKFFCLNTGWILKQQSFTTLPMLDRVIKHMNAIRLREKQGQAFRFLNCRQESYKWTDAVPKDDQEFQGLLEDDKEAAYPDISAESPGVELKSEEADYTAVTDEPEPDFEQLAATALDNAGIDPQDCLCSAQAVAATAPLRAGPALVEANDDKIVYEITFDLPDAGLAGGNVIQDDTLPPPAVGASIFDMADKTKF
jgi:hypothetical protein